MSDNVLVKGSMVNFIPLFSPAIVTPLPDTLSTSVSNVQINGKPVCLEGDENKVKVAGCLYFSAPFIIPGQGELTISELADNQKSKAVRCNGKAMLLVGKMFGAKCKVKTAAKFQPPPSPSMVSDPNPQYMGQGMFITTNNSVSAS